MSLENITSRIINDANSIGDNIMSDAASESNRILEESKAEASRIMSDYEARAKIDRDKLIQRRNSVAVLDGKKLFLEGKQELISECFKKAIDQVVSMKEEHYIDFIAGKIKDTGLLQGQILFNNKDRETIGTKVIERLEKLIPGSSFELSEETRNICGGFILKQGQSYINGSVEAMADEIRDELTGKVAEILFE